MVSLPYIIAIFSGASFTRRHTPVIVILLLACVVINYTWAIHLRSATTVAEVRTSEASAGKLYRGVPLRPLPTFRRRERSFRLDVDLTGISEHFLQFHERGLLDPSVKHFFPAPYSLIIRQ